SAERSERTQLVNCKMANAQHSTSSKDTIGLMGVSKKAARSLRAFAIRHSSFLFLLLAPFFVRAQTPPHVPPGGLIQLQVAQPAVDVTTPVGATASFDPPVVRPGEKTFYRVTVDATESSIIWPDKPSAPEKLKFGANARGMITQLQAASFRPLTSFLYE